MEDAGPETRRWIVTPNFGNESNFQPEQCLTTMKIKAPLASSSGGKKRAKKNLNKTGEQRSKVSKPYK